MNNRLRPILQATAQDLVGKKETQSLAALEAALADGKAPPRRDFAEALRRGAEGQAGDTKDGKKNLAIIAEIKRNSPSMGAIAAAGLNVEAQAKNYQAGGADCLSILTEPHFFKGQVDDLKAARAATTLPVLRKDFMMDRWQLAETRLMGADCALLIVAALGRDTATLLAAAQAYGLDVLVEVHNRTELEIALDANASIIGVNNRNLSDLTIDLAVAEKLRAHIPSHVLAIAESGLEHAGDYRRMRDAGFDAVLVGTSLMKSGNAAARLQEIRQELVDA